MQQVCAQPFTALEIDTNGNVYTCCPAYINEFNIGNIYENDNIETLWNGEKAQELRRKIINEDYSLCNLKLCRQKQLCQKENISEIAPLPQYITLAYDKECNLQCITCRDKKYKNTKEQIEIFNKKIDSILVPLIKEAKILALSGSGEAFYSTHSRMLIKKIAIANQDLKFNINTNGLLFNQQNCESLGIRNRINEVFVSLHAFDNNTYNKIMIGSNLEVVLKNIEYMSNAQKTGEINKVTINTVISDINYKEISKIVAFAKKLDIHITISQFYHWGTEFGKNYEKIAVWEEKHPNHIKFVKELKKINYDKCFLSPLFQELKQKKLHFWQF